MVYSLAYSKTTSYHCVKSVRIWSCSDSYFPAFELNAESLFSPNEGKNGPE